MTFDRTSPEDLATAPSLRIRCRPIERSDVDTIGNLLAKSGFGGSKDFWLRCLQRLAEHPTPPGLPKYGFLLEVNSVAVGVFLLIYSVVNDTTPGEIRCNVSSWYVWPA